MSKKQIELYRQFINPEDLVFDVGANVGDRTEVFLSLARRVIAFEPQADVYSQLHERFQREERVLCVNGALGAHFAFKELRFPKDGSRGRSGVASLSEEFRIALGPEIFNLENGWDGEEMVRVFRTEDAIGAWGLPAFIKIDVEGYELEVLHGLSKKIPALSFEFQPLMPEDWRACLTRLGVLGFTEYAFATMENFDLSAWMDSAAIEHEVGRLDGRRDVMGDIYAR